MKVDEVMTHDAVFCRSSDNLARAAQLMWDHDCGCVPIVDDEARVVGIVTDRDISMAALHSGRHLDELPVAHTMAKAPVTVRPEERISEALHVMSRARVRRLPVIDDAGRLAGLLSLHDLLRSATNDRRWFTGVTMREVARTLAEVSRPWPRPAPPEPKGSVSYAV